jgi:hypothetical protein
MNIFHVTLQAVITLLGIGILGFLIVKRKIIPENVMGVLATLSIDIALPSLVFANVLLDFSPAEYPGWWQLPLWWLFFQAIALVLSIAVFHFLETFFQCLGPSNGTRCRGHQVSVVWTYQGPYPFQIVKFIRNQCPLSPGLTSNQLSDKGT